MGKIFYIDEIFNSQLNNAIFRIYKEKTVLITGYTGFKGGWLSLSLNSLGANVIGISLDPNSKKSFNINKIEDKVEDIRLDIRNLEELKDLSKLSTRFCISFSGSTTCKEIIFRPRRNLEY